MVFPDEGWLALETRQEDADRLAKTEQACLRPMDDPEGIHAFILPSSSGVSTTTQFCVRACYGRTFHMLVSFKPLEEARSALATFDGTRDSDMEPGSDVDRGRMCVLQTRRLFSADRGPGYVPDADSGSESEFDSDVVISERIREVCPSRDDAALAPSLLVTLFIHRACWRLCSCTDPVGDAALASSLLHPCGPSRGKARYKE